MAPPLDSKPPSKSLNPQEALHSARFWSRVNVGNAGDCWPWSGSTNANGYGVFAGEKAHRVAYQQFNGEIPEGMIVMHRCDNPSCVNPSHLAMGTQADNVRDCIEKGRRNDLRGHLHPRARFTPDQIRAIRTSGKMGKELAGEYGTSRSVISQIRTYVTYRNV